MQDSEDLQDSKDLNIRSRNLTYNVIKCLGTNVTNILIKQGIAIYMEGIVQFLNMRAQHFAIGPRGLPEMIPMSIRHKIFQFFTDEQ